MLPAENAGAERGDSITDDSVNDGTMIDDSGSPQVQEAHQTVSLTLTLADQTAESFTAAKQTELKEGIGAALGVDLSNIALEIISLRRRLLGGLKIIVKILTTESETAKIVEDTQSEQFKFIVASNVGVSVESMGISIPDSKCQVD